jgi:hypothetical protein
MKAIITGIILVLGSSSIVIDKDKMLEDKKMITVNKKEIITGEDMIVRTSIVIDQNDNLETNKCQDTKCWTNIINQQIK